MRLELKQIPLNAVQQAFSHLGITCVWLDRYLSDEAFAQDEVTALGLVAKAELDHLLCQFLLNPSAPKLPGIQLREHLRDLNTELLRWKRKLLKLPTTHPPHGGIVLAYAKARIRFMPAETYSGEKVRQPKVAYIRTAATAALLVEADKLTGEWLAPRAVDRLPSLRTYTRRRLAEQDKKRRGRASNARPRRGPGRPPKGR